MSIKIAYLLLLTLLNVTYASFVPESDHHHHSSTTHIAPNSLLKRNNDKSPRKVPPLGYYNPYDGGGHLLTIIPVTYPMGQGEPINAVITGLSDSRVMVDQEVEGGLKNYFLSLGFSGQCLGQQSVEKQAANLGDGHGPKNETATMRWNYGDAQLGSCKETIEGGNHFRYWTQDGPSANSGAVFMAVSYEKPIAEQHDIIPNGYNLGRDWMIGNITQTEIPSMNLTNATTYSGTTAWGGYVYRTEIIYVSGMVPNTSDAINHNITVTVPGVNAADGLLAVMHVAITEEPVVKQSSSIRLSLSTWQLSLAVLLVSLSTHFALLS